MSGIDRIASLLAEDERSAIAGLQLLERLRAVLAGEVFVQDVMQATSDIFDDQEVLYGREEAQRIMGVVLDIFAETMAELKQSIPS